MKLLFSRLNKPKSLSLFLLAEEVRNKTATYVPLCEAQHTPNAARSFPEAGVNPPYSKSVLNPNPSPVPFSP